MPDEMPSRELRCCRLLKFTGEPRARPLTTAYDERREGRLATAVAQLGAVTKYMNAPVKGNVNPGETR